MQMNALTLSASRRRDQVVILNALDLRKSQTKRSKVYRLLIQLASGRWIHRLSMTALCVAAPVSFVAGVAGDTVLLASMAPVVIGSAFVVMSTEKGGHDARI